MRPGNAVVMLVAEKVTGRWVGMSQARRCSSDVGGGEGDGAVGGGESGQALQ